MKKLPFEKQTIFISRNLSLTSPFLNELQAEGHTVIHQSLIKINPIRFTHTPETDWIFFSSKNGIEHFFRQKPDIKRRVKFGVISPVSADFLQLFGHEADYIGSGIDMKRISDEFSYLVKDGSVLFPQALNSLKSIQQKIRFSSNCIDLYVYKNTPLPEISVPEADVLVFTSPSNASVYFEKYRYKSHQKVVAIGHTTKYRIKSYGVQDVLTPEEFCEESLLNSVLI